MKNKPVIHLGFSTDMLTAMMKDLILTEGTYNFCTVSGTLVMHLDHADNLATARELHAWLSERLKNDRNETSEI